MHCRHIAPGVIVCGPRPRRKKCSTPGCGRPADLECDHPVSRRSLKVNVGDARLHREHQVIFYVWSVDEDRLEVSTSPPPATSLEVRAARSPQRTTVADWFAKTSATCDRAVCSSCVVRAGALDLCPAHARAKESNV